jgi:hypothetical protein
MTNKQDLLLVNKRRNASTTPWFHIKYYHQINYFCLRFYLQPYVFVYMYIYHHYTHEYPHYIT